MRAALIALCAASIAGAVHAQDVASQKPGLWESRTLKMELDGQDILPQMRAARQQMRESMASLPPEQRKQMQAALGAQGGDPAVERICVSAEMARNEQAILQRPPSADCSAPKLNRNGNRTAFELTCKHGNGTSVSKGESVTTGDQISTQVETVTTEAGGRHTMVVQAQMKFLGSDCGGLKPLDQIAREMQGGAPARPAGARKK